MTGPISSFAKNDVVLGDALVDGGSGLLHVVALTNNDLRFFSLETGEQKDPSNAEVFTLQTHATLTL